MHVCPKGSHEEEDTCVSKEMSEHIMCTLHIGSHEEEDTCVSKEMSEHMMCTLHIVIRFITLHHQVACN
jgi:hypothetical protein